MTKKTPSILGQSSKNWVLPQTPSAQAETLAAELATSLPFPLSIAQILVERGINTRDEAKIFYAPQKKALHDPMLLKDMDTAVARIAKAKTEGEKILVYGDYDVDGTTAVTLMTLFLEAWGIAFDFYIPDRYTEGYGLSFKGIEYAEQIGASVLLCLDCGIKAHTPVKHANQKGIDVIICDHHKPGENMPEALAIIDPQREDCTYPETVLTGCGVGYKLCQALDTHWRAEGVKPEKDIDPFDTFCDLITLSIASDIVPITGENRIIACHGLEKLRTNPLPGIQALMNLSTNERSWNISDLVFFVGPHINAAGRLNHAKEAVDILRGKAENMVELAGALQKVNTERKEVDRLITNEALDLIGRDEHFSDRRTTVLYQPEWHKGVIGIVASRLIETHYRPTILFTKSENKLVGSARSVSKFDLYEALEACESHMIQFGGHAYAAGISLEEKQFHTFAAAFEASVQKRIKPEHLVPSLPIDGVLRFSEIDARLLKIIDRMEPFGPGNRRPVFIATDVEVTDVRKLKDLHVRLTLKQDGCVFHAIGFNMYSRWEEVNALSIDIAFQPSFNSWKGNVSIDLQLKDLRIAL